jgi:sialate O-acetylesterase
MVPLRITYLLVALLCYSTILSAQLSLAPSFSSNMVVQRNQPIAVWGKGLPGKKIVISFDNESIETWVSIDSTWVVYFKAQSASLKPQLLKAAMDTYEIRCDNILIGDVWICIGQSNMEWPLSREMHWGEEKKNASQTLLRFLNPPPAGRYVYNSSFTDSLLRRLNNDSFYRWNEWQTTHSSFLADMSAVAYYFAKKVVQETGIPIGLINLSIGGAPLESFIPSYSLQSHPVFSKKMNGDWRINEFLPVWIRTRGKQNLDSIQPLYGDSFGPHHAYKPGFAFSTGVEPLRQHGITGVLVYQGESNAEEQERVEEYGSLFKVLVESYRALWNKKDLPIYWAQLSSIERPLWPSFRNEQRKLLTEIPFSGMAVTSDVGHKNNVHPTDKQTVGIRLAYWALQDVYNKKLEVSGPSIKKAKIIANKVILYFSHANGLTTSDGKALREFSTDGVKELPAFIKGKRIILSITEKPSTIYYGWKPYSEGNLINKQRLPASTFKIDLQ